MDIFQIWARESDSPTASKWLVDAWDDDSIAGNHEGYSAALAKAREEHGADNVVVIVQAVDMDLIEAAFQPARIPSDGGVRDIDKVLVMAQAHLDEFDCITELEHNSWPQTMQSLVAAVRSVKTDEVPAERWKQMYINEARCHDAAVVKRVHGDRVISQVRQLALESDDFVRPQDILTILRELDTSETGSLDAAADAVANTVLPKPYTFKQLSRARAVAALGAAGHVIEIATIEQRDALPVGSALLDPQGVCVKYYGHWARANAVGEWNPTLPATLIHYGDGPTLTSEAHA